MNREETLEEIIRLQGNLVASEIGRVKQMMYNRCYLSGNNDIERHKKYVAKSKKLKTIIQELKEEVK